MSVVDPLLIARLALTLLDRLAVLPLEPGTATGRTVLVTSARAGEGKSFVTGLLHAALAAQHPGAGEVARIDSTLLGNGSGLFQPAAVGGALRALREHNALTVIDGPPLAACGALAHAVDAVLLVVDARGSSKRGIERALAEARLPSARLAGVVLNRREAALPRWLVAE